MKKIFDIQGNIIENPDLEKGKLVDSTRPITHRYKITQEEKGHYETVAEYSNGGKDIKWVVDTPEEGYWAAYDENHNEVKTDITIPEDAPHEIDINGFEDILRYVLYTDKELIEIDKNRLNNEISMLKQSLADTDYIVIKVAEGVSSWDEYPDIKEQREMWRDKINELEVKLATM